MSPGRVTWVLGALLIAPVAFAVLFALTGRSRRALKAGSLVYAFAVVGLDLALLNGFLVNRGPLGWSSLALTRTTFPLLFVLEIISAAVVLYAGFRRQEWRGTGVVTGCVAAGTTLTALALLSSSIIPFAFLFEGVTVLALAGLAAQGGSGLKRRLSAFVPWLVSDVLFLLAAVLSTVWLNDRAVLIEFPIDARYSEVQIILVVTLFLLSAYIRLGMYPMQFYLRELFSRSDPAWSAFFLGASNFLLAGARLMVATVLIARHVAGDWGTALVIVGAVTMVAGPVTAVRAQDMNGYLSGMYSLQGGFLLAGLGLYFRAGLNGALFLLATAPLFLAAAIMAAGSTTGLRGTAELGRHPLSARRAPAALAVLLLSGMSLAGLPPMDGFVSKALIAMGNLDKFAYSGVCVLTAAAAFAGVAVGALALARSLGGVFAGGGKETAEGPRPGWGEALAPLLLSAGSLMLGLFPGEILRNFILGSAGSSIALYPNDFKGRAIRFGSGTNALAGASGLQGWSGAAAAFLLLVVALALAVYFLNRARNPVAPGGPRVEPFTGGTTGGYSSSAGVRAWYPRSPVERWWRRS